MIIQKKKKYKPDDKEQSARFVEKAKQIRADDSKIKFEEICSKVLKPKKPH